MALPQYLKYAAEKVIKPRNTNSCSKTNNVHYYMTFVPQLDEKITDDDRKYLNEKLCLSPVTNGNGNGGNGKKVVKTGYQGN